MSAIYGLMRAGDRPIDAGELTPMREAIAYWGTDGGGECSDERAALGQLISHDTPEAKHWGQPFRAQEGHLLFVAAARLDNRDELLSVLDIPTGERETTPDAALALRAYEKWGEEAPPRLFGDWIFAAWHPRERRLFLARDHFGNTALYYHHDAHGFAFASGIKALLALPHVRRAVDEWSIARRLVVWPDEGRSTFYAGIARVPPGHTLRFDDSGVQLREYWEPAELPAVRLGSDDEYVERFLELFGAAVRARVRSMRPIVSTLSSGLDSGAVTALAARELRPRGTKLTAYTSVPLHAEELARVLPDAAADEWPLARRSAEWIGGVDQRAIRAEALTPLEAMNRSLAVHDQPEWSAGNLPWVYALLDDARNVGAGVLLTGQAGNAGVSWSGDRDTAYRRLAAGDLPGAYRALHGLKQRERRSWAAALWSGVVWPLRRRMRDAFLPARVSTRTAHRTAIQTAFADRIGLVSAMRRGGFADARTARSSREGRLQILMPGRTGVGALWHEMGAAYGLDVRDPTGDVRLLEFCLSIPDDLFARAEGDRWLIRRSMEGLLPPEVQWNRRRGVQGLDFAWRLRADAANVDRAVARAAASATVTTYLDADALQAQWQHVRRSGDAKTAMLALHFGRQLLLALFLERFD